MTWHRWIAASLLVVVGSPMAMGADTISWSLYNPYSKTYPINYITSPL